MAQKVACVFRTAALRLKYSSSTLVSFIGVAARTKTTLSVLRVSFFKTFVPSLAWQIEWTFSVV
jgi:hypothetical protein